jgi:cbb3-type cytochrome oxidase maturation protein
MSVILVLVTISMIVAGSFLGAFIWAMKSGQYEDTFSPSVRILFEEKQEENTMPKK